MQEYRIEPLIGVGPVRLGMARDDVHSVMRGEPQTFQKGDSDLDAYHGGAFQVFYHDQGNGQHVEFIELSRGADFIALYKGIDVFAAQATSLVELIARDAPFDEHDPELGYSYIFPELELSIWRPVIPRSRRDRDGQHFSTIGIGIQGYYSDALI